MIDTDERALAVGLELEEVAVRCGEFELAARANEARAHLRRRLAQSDQSEPVAWGVDAFQDAMETAHGYRPKLWATGVLMNGRDADRFEGWQLAMLYTHPDRTQAPGGWRPIATLPSMKHVALYHPRFGATKTPRITHEYSGIDPRNFADDGYTHWREPMEPPAAAPTPPSVP